MRKGFLFDMNKCVGCQACVIACQIENHAVQSEPWRKVSTFNTFQHPLLPLFHFSLACNHCEIPLCLEYCPSQAYTRNELLQTIDHHDGRCVGCRYCTWACPYDAPKFIHARGVVEKCTLCKERIEAGLKPNCANLCPTGALDFGDIGGEPVVRVPGFVDKGIRPGIKLVPLRRAQVQHSTHLFESDAGSKVYSGVAFGGGLKMSLRQEWPLVVFTVLVAVLFGAIASSIFTHTVVDPSAFLATGIVAMGLSTFHLGKKGRAWRALINLRTSWLSREVGAYLFFLILSAASFFAIPTETIKIVAALAGLAALVSIDMVYSIAENRSAPGLCSGSVVLTGLLFMSAFAELWWPFIILSGVKFLLYGNEFVGADRRGLPRTALAVVRIVAGLILPLVLLGGSSGHVMAVISLLIGEVINRAEFYIDLEVLTPQRQIERDLLKELRQTNSIGGLK